MKTKTPKASTNEQASESVEGEDQYVRIAEIAYYKAESRGFEAGHDLDDWFDAERELLSIESR